MTATPAPVAPASAGGAHDAPWLPRALWLSLVAALAVTGLVVRVLPLVQGPGILVQQPTEDGFLMLTVARNMALGLGMSTAEGTIPTNGVQPLATFVWALCYVVAGADKVGGIAWVMGLGVAIAGAAALAVHRLGKVVFAGMRDGGRLAALAAALWWASPVVTAHSVNALETGLYLFLIAVTLRHFLVHASDPDADASWRHVVVLGVLLGVTFWARNDAVFLVAALGAARVLPALSRGATVLLRRVREAVAFGVVAGLVGAPWMIHNLVFFGSIVPQSGHSQRPHGFAPALPRLPAKLAEYVSVTGAIPTAMETWVSVQAACSLVLVACLVVAIRLLRSGDARVRTLTSAALVHAALLCVYYGFFFGAPHFLSRYIAPLSVPLALFTVGVAFHVLRADRWRLARAGLAVALAAVAVALDVRWYRNNLRHMHFQVVEWVRDHLTEETWVGAVQTGTLGYFHDRTINLDGKTNPATVPLREPARMRDYIVASRIEYLVDWNGLRDWRDLLDPEFRLIVDDADANLAVYERAR